jgi:AcrR family transcriptional regulator
MTRETNTRRYTKRRRAEAEEATRTRIAEAAMRLHGSVGPAQTTISAVAERAGVQRATVYRHFPTEADLFGACSAHWAALHPPPDWAAWEETADTDARLRGALGEIYAWYGSDARMFVNVRRDASLVPARAGPVAAGRAATQAMIDALMRGRRERGRRRKRVLAAVTHAVTFWTWHSLTQEAGLSDSEAVDLMAATVAAAATDAPPGSG